MKDTAYAFAVSSVRVRECSVLTKSQREILVASEGETGALRILEDCGYSGITDDAESVLSKKTEDVTEYIREISPDPELLSFLFVKNDYHNLKAAMKCYAAGVDPAPYFLSEAAVSHSDILRAVNEKNFDILPEGMRAAASAAWEAVVTEMNGQLCEVILDRGAIEASVRIAEDSGDGFCVGLAKLRSRLSSVMIAYRCAMAKKTGDFILRAMPRCEEYLPEKLTAAAQSGARAVADVSAEYGIVQDDSAGLSELAALSKSFEDEYIGRSAYVSMGAAPLVSYFIKMEEEVSFIRILLSCKRCGFTEEETRRRVGMTV